jgi:tRNA A37 threonylcarbamoyladenosine dehydratase
MTELQTDEYDRRFAGVAKIYGDDAFTHYEKSHVMVIGIGGVGSWAVEALARTGIGELTLVDMDVLAASILIVSYLRYLQLWGRKKQKSWRNAVVRLTRGSRSM